MVTVSVAESTTEFFERERSFMMKSWCSTILMASCEYPSVSAASSLRVKAPVGLVDMYSSRP